MGPTIAREGERLHVLADAFEASAYLKDELARDPASASRAVLWLSYPAGEEGNSAASSSLIEQGIAQVSLVRKPPQLSREAGNIDIISDVAVGALGGDGGGGDVNRLWLPATVLPIDVECPRNNQQHGWRQLRTTTTSSSSSSSRGSSNRLLSSSPARTAPHGTPVEDNGGKQPQEYSRPRQHCSAFLSPCLAEALGLPSVVVAAAADDPSGPSESSVGLFPAVVELSIRELPASRAVPAASIELSGPYPMVTAAGPSIDVGASQRNPPPVAQPLSPPPPSLVAAVSSILPFALEGEVLSAGSVVHVTGLFAFVVTGVWAEGEWERRVAVDKEGSEEDEEAEHAQKSMPSTGDGVGAVVRAHVATELRLLPPSPSTRARPCGVVLGGGATPAAAAAAAAASAGGGLTLGYPGHQRIGITTTVTTPAGRQQDDGTDTSTEESTVSGTEGGPTSRLPPSAAAATAAAVRPTPPGSGPPDPRQQWVQRVGQDFGGQADKVAAAVATVRSALWGKEVGGVGDVCGGGGGGRMGLAAPSSGLLLHGPTGVGKTLLARSVAEHSGAPWFFLDCASVFRRERGEAEKYVQNFLGNAGKCSPSVVVLDQVESLCRKRPEAAGITELQVFSVLLEQMDSFRRPSSLPRVFFLATCPDPTTLDPSLLQRGRLESVLRLGQLDSTGRASILRIHTRGMLLQLLPQPLVAASGKDSDSLKNALATKGAASGKDCNVGVAEKNTSYLDIHKTGALEAPVSASGSGGGTPSSPCGEENVVGCVSIPPVNRRAAAEAAGSAAVVVSVAVTPSLPPPPPLQPQPQPQPGTREEFLRLVSAKCHGYLGSDLERLCREAALHHMASFKSAAARTRAVSASPPKRIPALEGFRVTRAAAVARGEDPADRNRRQEFSLATGGVREGSWYGSEGGEGRVRLQDFWAALDVVRPASLVGHSVGMRAGNGGAEGAALVGCDEAMAELRAFLLTPLENPSLLRNLGIRAATGALLHGPPGCGKTSVARALAQESRGVANFLEVRCSDLVDKVVGRSERAVSDLFAAARASAPCILFLDQVEGVAARRGYHSSTEQTFDRILSTLLIEMDGVMSESGGHVVVLAATNDIASLDPALLRPGRLDRRIHLRPPDSTARTAILLQRLLVMPLHMERGGLGREEGSGNHAGGSLAGDPAAAGKDKDSALWEGERKLEQGRNRSCTSNNHNNNNNLGGGSELPRPRRGLLDTREAYATWLAGETEGGSGADVTGVCREAALAALREDIEAREVAPRHFEAALRGQRPRAVVGGGGGP